MFKTQLTNVIFFSLSFVFVTMPSTTIQSNQSLLSSTKVRNNLFPGEKRAKVSPKAPLNKQGVQFVSNYIKKNEQSLRKIKNKSLMPFQITDKVFSKYSLPIELKYLSVIESELKSSALSRVGALGPWQLMPVTARILGLKITRKYDERTSYQKSTEAAAKYLRDLYTEFGDWLLVVAAYNSGPGPVYKAIRKTGSRNFWTIQNYLPAETRGHVKKFIATHYYFEGQGSVTTLTKSENAEYTKALKAFVSAHKGALISEAEIKELIQEKDFATK